MGLARASPAAARPGLGMVVHSCRRLSPASPPSLPSLPLAVVTRGESPLDLQGFTSSCVKPSGDLAAWGLCAPRGPVDGCKDEARVRGAGRQRCLFPAVLEGAARAALASPTCREHGRRWLPLQAPALPFHPRPHGPWSHHHLSLCPPVQLSSGPGWLQGSHGRDPHPRALQPWQGGSALPPIAVGCSGGRRSPKAPAPGHLLDALKRIF